jgi:hypothetical protein
LEFVVSIYHLTQLHAELTNLYGGNKLHTVLRVSVYPSGVPFVPTSSIVAVTMGAPTGAGPEKPWAVAGCDRLPLIA